MANYLFFIGINNYLHQTKLNCCVKDCHDIKDILIDKYDFSPDFLVELYNENATNINIQNAFIKFCDSLAESDNLIIYYSGHGGFRHSTESGFWIPYDSNTDNFSTWLSNEIIHSYIEKMKAKHVFLISDSCFSRSILITNPTKAVFADAKDYDFFSSRWALTSGAEECKDGDPGENSLFGETIINALTENEEDLRVSKLIEIIKESYKFNKFQKPQGYPLSTITHKGGEFIFRIEEIGYQKQIKGHKDLFTILQLYRKSSFKEVGIFENKTQRIGYQLFQEHDVVQMRVSYFLYLYEGIVQRRTYEYIRKKHPEIFKEKNLIILIPKEKHLKSLEKRKNNIKEKFQPLNIYYIDEFIRTLCTPEIFTKITNEKYLGIQNFILPTIEYKKSVVDDINFFSDWLINENEPILIIKGEGGIGKTTIAQFVADKFQKFNPNSFVMFIDSSEIITELINRENKHGITGVYNFYEAIHDSRSKEEIISEDLFRLNFDAGNFLLIVDGLDEVISKDPKFDVNKFLDSIVSYTSDMGKGKTIIACRSYFWEASRFSSESIKTIEILPFNIHQTKKFFEKSFPNEPRKAEKALKIAEEFKFKDENGSGNYHPYVLDVVRIIVESNQQILTSDDSFDSKMLEKSVKNDYIIYRICFRETLRVEQISVDDQINFFLYWSIKRRGVITLENFTNEIKEALGKHIDNKTVEAFKSHPFIEVANKTIRFKYDFFADYFKSIFVSMHISLSGPYIKISDDFLKIVYENCWYGSSMITDIKNRVTIWTENELLKCSDLIDQMQNLPPERFIYVQKCLSGLLNICLALNIKFKSNTIEHNTDLMIALFGKPNNQVYGLHIINMHSSEEVIRFDFREKTFRNCLIDNYHSFWKCLFNQNTFFVKSSLLNLDFANELQIPIPRQNFHECTTDDKFNSAYRNADIHVLSIGSRARLFLTDFFTLFYSKGMLHSRTLKYRAGRDSGDTIIKRFNKVSSNFLEIDFDDLIKILEKADVVRRFDDKAEDKIEICPNYRSDTLKFIKDGSVSPVISNIISMIRDLVKV